VTEERSMQKLVTIYLTNEEHSAGRFFEPNAKLHGFVEQHLERELAQGWTVQSVTGLGGLNEFGIAKGWLAVVLEKRDA
jgi:hypothetical protein